MPLFGYARVSNRDQNLVTQDANSGPPAAPRCSRRRSRAGFKSLKDAWADTTSAHGRLMLTVLGGLAEFERELIRARTGEGRKRAKERGVRFGRPRKMTPHQRQEARLAAGEPI